VGGKKMKLNTLLLCLTAIMILPGMLFAHYIKVDGEDDDWEGVSPAIDSFGYSNCEGIWRDAEEDDTGDGGDAPNAQDNPNAYSYPTSALFSGTEADLLEFRVTVDDNPDSTKIFFLVRVEYFENWAPYIGILMDIDHIPGSGETDCGGYSDTFVSEENAWEYAVYLYNLNVSVVDSEGSPVPGFHSNYFSSDNNLIEVGIDVAGFSPTPLGKTVYFSVFSGLHDFDHMRDVNYDSSEWAGGGGLNEYVNPKIFDLAFVSSEDQANDLNNYTDSEKATIRASTVMGVDLSQTTAVQIESLGRLKSRFK
jgi:hypothetical protein